MDSIGMMVEKAEEKVRHDNSFLLAPSCSELLLLLLIHFITAEEVGPRSVYLTSVSDEIIKNIYFLNQLKSRPT